MSRGTSGTQGFHAALDGGPPQPGRDLETVSREPVVQFTAPGPEPRELGKKSAHGRVTSAFIARMAGGPRRVRQGMAGEGRKRGIMEGLATVTGQAHYG